MKVLVIDDIQDSVKGILDSCDENGWEKKISDFDDAYSSIMEFDPDIIVLDWKDDAEQVDTGEGILDKIWNITFRPVILFTANASVISIDEKLAKSNMIRIIEKGDESPVIDYLTEMSRFASELSSYRQHLGSALIESLNSIEYLKNERNIEPSSVSYTLSKRTAAFFDDQFISALSPCWVQYLCPPISDCLCVCDIIRVRNTEDNMKVLGNPEEYKIILTPSCDMAHGDQRPPKVTHALCANCYAKDAFHDKTLSESPSQRSIVTVKKKLNSGYNGNFVPLPGFSSVIPYMTADLKKLELIPLNQIAPNIKSITEDSTHYRVASICSPFREQIVWAHLHNSCRPGVPDRNTELWAKDILTR